MSNFRIECDKEQPSRLKIVEEVENTNSKQMDDICLLDILSLNKDAVKQLIRLGVLKRTAESCRDYNIGKSNYSKHLIQPYTIWLDYPELTSWDHDIIKRVLRQKEDTPRREDYEKIIHIAKERIRQIDEGYE